MFTAVMQIRICAEVVRIHLGLGIQIQKIGGIKSQTKEKRKKLQYFEKLDALLTGARNSFIKRQYNKYF
jgi:hypothetical protein